MKRADFEARIKRIEITNKSQKDGWRQTIRVVLDDIALSNENLLELRQFKPNEDVTVIIRPVQIPPEHDCGQDEKPLLEISENSTETCRGRISKSWSF